MKILFVTKYIESAGGISGQVRLLRECLIKEGHVADVFSTDGSVVKRLGMFSQLMRKACLLKVTTTFNWQVRCFMPYRIRRNHSA